MNALHFFNIYPDEIEACSDKCEAALIDAGYHTRQIDDMYDEVKKSLTDGSINSDNITNGIMGEMLSRTQGMLQERFPNANIDYYVNGLDTHLYINGEDFNKGDDTVKKLSELKNLFLPKDDPVECTFEDKKAIEVPVSIEDDDVAYFISIAGSEPMAEIAENFPEDINISVVLVEDGTYFLKIYADVDENTVYESVKSSDEIEDVDAETLDAAVIELLQNEFEELEPFKDFVEAYTEKTEDFSEWSRNCKADVSVYDKIYTLDLGSRYDITDAMPAIAEGVHAVVRKDETIENVISITFRDNDDKFIAQSHDFTMDSLNLNSIKDGTFCDIASRQPEPIGNIVQSHYEEKEKSVKSKTVERD